MTVQRQSFATKDAVTQVFYDGACPLCAKEIAHYRRLEARAPVRWVDISRDQAALDANGLTKDQAMQRLHLRDAAGAWHTGAWAFAALWSQLPGYRWLAALLRHSRTLPLVDRGYTRFARWRVRRRCDTGVCEATVAPAAQGACPGDPAITDPGSGTARTT